MIERIISRPVAPPEARDCVPTAINVRFNSGNSKELMGITDIHRALEDRVQARENACGLACTAGVIVTSTEVIVECPFGELGCNLDTAQAATDHIASLPNAKTYNTVWYLRQFHDAVMTPPPSTF